LDEQLRDDFSNRVGGEVMDTPNDLPSGGFTWRLRRALGFTERDDLNKLLVDAANLERERDTLDALCNERFEELNEARAEIALSRVSVEFSKNQVNAWANRTEAAESKLRTIRDLVEPLRESLPKIWDAVKEE